MFSMHPAEWQVGQVAKAIVAGGYLRLECGRFPKTSIAPVKQNNLLDRPGP